MPDSIIRPLTPDDAEAYVSIRKRMLTDEPLAFASSPDSPFANDPEAVRARLREHRNVIVGGFRGGDLAATCGIVEDRGAKQRHKAWIVGVYVAPEARGLGLGRGVVSAAIDIARGWDGVDTVSLSVTSKSPAARGLYEALGFVAWGVEPRCLKIGDEAADEIHMQLPLGR